MAVDGRPDGREAERPREQLSESVPQPTRWVGRWPWSRWTRWQRTSVAGQLASRALLGLASITSAIVLLLGLGPQILREVYWREREYEALSGVHAGNSLAYLVQQLGQPAFVRPATSGLTQHIFTRRDHLVLVVTNEAEEAVVVSVTSCSPEFAPGFETPLRSRVQLQSRPLGEADRAEPGMAGGDAYRQLSYAPWTTASSTGQLLEEGAAPSNASRGRGYYVGVNAICADIDSLGLGTEPWSGPLNEAPEPVRRARERIAANFYAETIDLEVQLGDNAQLDIAADGTWVGGLFASPHHFDLPLSVQDPAGTRRF